MHTHGLGRGQIGDMLEQDSRRSPKVDPVFTHKMSNNQKRLVTVLHWPSHLRTDGHETRDQHRDNRRPDEPMLAYEPMAAYEPMLAYGGLYKP